jgi:hypothetical protein
VIPAKVALPCGITFALIFQFFDDLVNSFSYGRIHIVFRGQRMQSGFSLCRKRYQQCVVGCIENIYQCNEKIPKEQAAQMIVQRDPIFPDLNYKLLPPKC